LSNDLELMVAGEGSLPPINLLSRYSSILLSSALALSIDIFLILETAFFPKLGLRMSLFEEEAVVDAVERFEILLM